MKIAGIDPKLLPSMEVLVLPRGDQRLVFRARGVSDTTEFKKLCPEPKIPVRLTATGPEQNLNHPDYKSEMQEYGKRYIAWLVLKSLEPSEIEWDTVKIDVPGTWVNWEEDMRQGGLSQHECNLVVALVSQANSLDEAKLKAARDVFLRGPQPE